MAFKTVQCLLAISACIAVLNGIRYLTQYNYNNYNAVNNIPLQQQHRQSAKSDDAVPPPLISQIDSNPIHPTSSSGTIISTTDTNAERPTTNISTASDAAATTTITPNSYNINNNESPEFLNMYNNCESNRKGEGVILLNLLGRLANNLFEISYANRLAQDLCWKIIYRGSWDHELPSERGHTCLPNNWLPQDSKKLPDLNPQLMKDANLTQDTWNYILSKNQNYRSWINSLIQQNRAMKLQQINLQGNATEHLMEQLHHGHHNLRVLNMNGFFIHYDWMKNRMDDVRHQLTINPECCFHTPPEDAIVFHIREFSNPKLGGHIQYDHVYPKLIQHYNWTHRPIWVVCQPKTMTSNIVKAIAKTVQEASGSNITIVPGQDQYDALCTLTRAKTLVGSYGSSYSQMGGLLLANNDAQYHQPLSRTGGPLVTVGVPEWRYHLVDNTKQDFHTYDVPYNTISFKKG